MNYDDKLAVIKRCVAEYYNVPIERLFSNVRDIQMVHARQVVLFLLKTRLSLPLREIAQSLDVFPATIMHAVKRVRSDANLRRDVEEISHRIDEADRQKSLCSSGICELKDAHWRQVVVFLQEAGTVIDYLLRRVYAKQAGEELSEPVLYAETADDDGPLTDELTVHYLDAMARQARAGFVDGSGFPVFGSMEWSKKGGANA